MLKNLQQRLDETAAHVTYSRLPTVRADDVLLAQVLQNLIENAVKYHGEASPEIHISSLREQTTWVFSVRDNGIGIAPEHRQRIFQMFQRLHQDESRYTGCGIGLATCRRIVEKHSGRIWVESKLGQGSTFHFSLPV